MFRLLYKANFRLL